MWNRLLTECNWRRAVVKEAVDTEKERTGQQDNPHWRTQTVIMCH